MPAAESTAAAPVPGFGAKEAVSVIERPAANVPVGEPEATIPIGIVSDTFMSVPVRVIVVVRVVVVDNVAELNVVVGTVADGAAGVSVRVIPAGKPVTVNRILVPLMPVEFPLVVFCVDVLHADANPSEITIPAVVSMIADPGDVKRLNVPPVPMATPLIPAPKDVISDGMEVGAM
jgi:hypothetical protein